MERDESAEPERDDRRVGPFGLRRAKIAAEIERNRRGEYVLPTWALALTLVLFVAAWATWVMLS